MDPHAASAAGGIHRRLDRWLGGLENAAAVVAGGLMLVMMVLASADAILRYSINSPIRIQAYLTENYLMLAVAVLPMAWGFRTGGYIRLNMLEPVLPRAAYVVLLRAGLLVSSAFTALMCGTGWMRFREAYEANEVHMGVIDWPVAWSWVWVPIGSGLLAARLALMAFGPAAQVNNTPESLETAAS